MVGMSMIFWKFDPSKVKKIKWVRLQDVQTRAVTCDDDYKSIAHLQAVLFVIDDQAYISLRTNSLR